MRRGEWRGTLFRRCCRRVSGGCLGLGGRLKTPARGLAAASAGDGDRKNSQAGENTEDFGRISKQKAQNGAAIRGAAAKCAALDDMPRA